MNLHRYILLLLLLCQSCNTNEAPTGVSRIDVEGIWSGRLNEVTLLGRSLSGELDWQFGRNTFTILFFDPPEGQAEQISGDWKFDNRKLVLTLRSSFPIGSDAGTTDSLFVSILDNQMSIHTSDGSNILLQKIRGLVLWSIPRLFPPARFFPSNLPSFKA